MGAELERLTGKETRVVVLGHLQRGGAPTPADRVLATRFGAKAVELVINGQFGMMVANRPPDIVPVPFQDVVGKMKTVAARQRPDDERASAGSLLRRLRRQDSGFGIRIQEGGPSLT